MRLGRFQTHIAATACRAPAAPLQFKQRGSVAQCGERATPDATRNKL